jgi:hypothetical protein
MTVVRTTRTQGATQETAQALVAGGDLRAAVELLDRYLSQFDGDWGIWLYFAGLCARLGKRSEAVAAYRACARQLEGDGHFDRAREALRAAIQLMPKDGELKRELEQVGRPPRRPDPAQETFLLMPAITPNPVAQAPQRKMQPQKPTPPAPQAKPKLPPAAVHLTAVIPGRKRRPAPPPPPPPLPSELTDPHCAIFDIIDSDREGRSNRVGSPSVVSARRGRGRLVSLSLRVRVGVRVNRHTISR